MPHCSAVQCTGPDAFYSKLVGQPRYASSPHDHYAPSAWPAPLLLRSRADSVPFVCNVAALAHPCSFVVVVACVAQPVPRRQSPRPCAGWPPSADVARWSSVGLKRHLLRCGWFRRAHSPPAPCRPPATSLAPPATPSRRPAAARSRAPADSFPRPEPNTCVLACARVCVCADLRPPAP